MLLHAFTCIHMRVYSLSLETQNMFSIYAVSQKTRHQTLSHNFINYYPIFNLFSLADLVVNLQQAHV